MYWEVQLMLHSLLSSLHHGVAASLLVERNVLDIFTLDDDDTVLPQNIRIQLPLEAASYSRRVEFEVIDSIELGNG
jgi:hypothetical protein